MAFFSHSHLLQCRGLQGLQVVISFTINLLGLQVVIVPHHSFHQRWQGSLPPSFLTHLSVHIFFHSHKIPLQTPLKYVFTELFPPLLIGLLLARVGSDFGARGASGNFLEEPPHSLPPSYQNPATRKPNTFWQDISLLTKN